jgi:PIN domain nuclease of toxin-antitoxin system
MRYLLDTHVLIWHAENHQMNQDALDIINDPTNTILISHATLWEMTIKVSVGKLKLNFPIADFQKLLAENQFLILPFDFKYYEILSQLPFHHQDPFDRMLIAQAIVENIPIITHDAKFKLYNVTLIDISI